MTDYDITDLSADGAQEARLRPFTPTDDYRRYCVTFMYDRYDKDVGKGDRTIYAIGSTSAREIVLDQVQAEHPDACVLSVEEVVGDTRYHDECGYLWELHDNKVAGRKLPFGCPSEFDVREAWGDR